MAMEINNNYQNNLQAAFVDKISSIKEKSSEASNALANDAMIKVEISALGAEELEKVRQSWDNKPSSALYRTDRQPCGSCHQDHQAHCQEAGRYPREGGPRQQGDLQRLLQRG